MASYLIESFAEEIENTEILSEIYDIILNEVSDYLLEKGYADTKSQAYKIALYMSDDWEDDIVTEFFGVPERKNSGLRGKLYAYGKRLYTGGKPHETNKKQENPVKKKAGEKIMKLVNKVDTIVPRRPRAKYNG